MANRLLLKGRGVSWNRVSLSRFIFSSYTSYTFFLTFGVLFLGEMVWFHCCIDLWLFSPCTLCCALRLSALRKRFLEVLCAISTILKIVFALHSSLLKTRSTPFVCVFFLLGRPWLVYKWPLGDAQPPLFRFFFPSSSGTLSTISRDDVLQPENGEKHVNSLGACQKPRGKMTPLFPFF